MEIQTHIKRMYETLQSVYTLNYLLLNAIVFVIYYILYVTIIKSQQHGYFIVSFPAYFAYLIIFTASVMLTIAVYSAKNTRNNEAKEVASVLGMLTAVATGVVGGCGCAEPILLGLTTFGLSTDAAFSVNNFVSSYQIPIFSLMIVINLFVIVYYLDKLSRPSCKIRKR